MQIKFKSSRRNQSQVQVKFMNFKYLDGYQSDPETNSMVEQSSQSQSLPTSIWEEFSKFNFKYEQIEKKLQLLSIN